MIYVASPYSHPDPQVMQRRMEQAFEYTCWLMSQGQTAFCPVAYGHQFWLAGAADHNHVPWIDFNERIMFASENIHVLKLAGWENSQGIAHEIAFARKHGIPYQYVEWPQ